MGEVVFRPCLAAIPRGDRRQETIVCPTFPATAVAANSSANKAANNSAAARGASHLASLGFAPTIVTGMPVIDWIRACSFPDRTVICAPIPCHPLSNSQPAASMLVRPVRSIIRYLRPKIEHAVSLACSKSCVLSLERSPVNWNRNAADASCM